MSLGKGLKRGGTQQRTSLLEFITQITCATYDDDDDEHYDDIYDDDYEHYDNTFHYWNSLSKSPAPTVAIMNIVMIKFAVIEIYYVIT